MLLFKILLIFLLFSLTFSLNLTKLKRKKIDKIIKKNLNDCETNKNCSKFDQFTSSNCVLECLSSFCYHEFYGINPLEEGEIDTKRYNQFHKCVREEIYRKEFSNENKDNEKEKVKK